jgi:hypothetical protein
VIDLSRKPGLSPGLLRLLGLYLQILFWYAFFSALILTAILA